MSERVTEQRARQPEREYDRFGFNGHFEPCCEPSEDRSSVGASSELAQSGRFDRSKPFVLR
jgi:hypothetical protein